jgi:hypothetical protein
MTRHVAQTPDPVTERGLLAATEDGFQIAIPNSLTVTDFGEGHGTGLPRPFRPPETGGMP